MHVETLLWHHACSFHFHIDEMQPSSVELVAEALVAMRNPNGSAKGTSFLLCSPQSLIGELSKQIVQVLLDPKSHSNNISKALHDRVLH